MSSGRKSAMKKSLKKKEFNKLANSMIDNAVSISADNKGIDSSVDEAFLDKYARMYQNPKVRIEVGKNQLGEAVNKIKNDVFKTYLPYLDHEHLYRPHHRELMKMNYLFRVRIIKITKWVTEKGENSLDKLKNVYSALSRPYCSFAMVADRTMEGTDIYFVMVNQRPENDPAIVDSLFELFTSALKGNFPGVEYVEIKDDFDEEDDSEFDGDIEKVIAEKDFEYDYAVENLIEKWISNEKSVSMVTNIPSEKSEDFQSQGIEKLLDGIVPTNRDDEYTLIFLAESVHNDEIVAKEEEFSSYHSVVNPYVSWQDSESLSDVMTKGLVSNATKNVNSSSSKSLSISPGVGLGFSKSQSIGYAESLAISKTISKSDTSTVTLTKTDNSLEQTKVKLESQISRLQNGSSLGMWRFATYILSKDYTVANNVANMYRSLTQGDDSYVECAATNIWNVSKKGSEKSVEIINQYLSSFMHPYFELVKKGEGFLPEIAEGYTYINGSEIAMAMNMPNAAVSGLPVIECAEFGRDVISQSYDYKPEVNLGKVFHMQREEQNKYVCLDSKSLTEHVFITGSTGAGKSTTIYRLLSEAVKLDVKNSNEKVTFMVIEPAKGEYRKELQKHTDQPITVYGTNPMLDGTNLLKINPFSFPAGKIHILEHLDRLIEIFNVCWPMYAAMPAVLKKGIEEAYAACGWDLLRSRNRISNTLFPSFADVCNNIRTVIEQSDYSAENKGDYKGALVTRLESLTNGINGLIFVADEISEEDLFDKNTIVDLSRVGSTETKALIMGLLVMKLQEYRMSRADDSNSPLKHITVLEEAHNLLKRTSSEQSAEGSNLIGKSVEMLSNSIAEMRTYGEAFIIADQAPGLMDMSVIRNTNTKIIMRLPDYSDRELVGKAANLNEDQIIEIAKLKPGVAAVYYNGWINPVLCKVPYSKPDNRIKETDFAETVSDSGSDYFEKFEYNKKVIRAIFRFDSVDNVEVFRKELITSGLSGEFISRMYDFCDSYLDQYERKKKIPELIYLFFNPHQAMKKAENLNSSDMVHDYLVQTLNISEISEGNKRLEDMIILNILHEHNIRTQIRSELYVRYADYVDKKYFVK